MIVSALLTSVGINTGLSVLLLSLYSVLRKQPGNVYVYAPRGLAEEQAKREGPFSLERLVPSPGWILRAWRLSEDEFLSAAGFDAFVFMRIFIFSVRIFSIAGIIGIFVLLPLNYTGNQLRTADWSNISNQSLDLFTIANVKDSSKRLWVHFCAVYLISGAACVLLYLNEAEKLYKRILHLRNKPRLQRKSHREGFLGLFGAKVDPVDLYTKKLEDVGENLKLEQLMLYQNQKELPAAFVSFKSCYGAATASRIVQSSNPMLWVTEPAPEPRDIYWPFLSAPYIQLWISKFVVVVAVFFLTILFLIPVTLVQGLTQLTELEAFLPFLKKVLKITIVGDIVTGYLPSLILQMFLFIVPPIMMLFAAMRGYISNGGKMKSACVMMLYFTIWNVFFATVLSGSVISQINTFISNPKDIPRQLAVAVPGQATFFIAYVLTSGWTGLSLEIARLFPLITNFLTRHCCKVTDDADCAPLFPYHRDIPKVLLFGLLGFTYSLLAPLIMPFLLVYFFVGYIFYRNQLLKVYSPRFETAGQFWPIVHNCTIFSLVFMQIIAIGIFGVKKLPFASGWVIPTTVITLLFNDYCRKRFLPVFNRYPAEILIKKDREDERNPQMMSSFLDSLVNAYRDPALQPVQYSLDESGSRTSLLSSS